ncbi:MAG TPA: hypothetical protein O0X46_05365 [Methanocorpusculum sp.]|nr:hypothetical protein [Methanocorpusculum sp.]HJK03514.1 hypothetical protein [Methanocorpusculum sp.]HJK06280.1 hypothetical protein [Methanocorpusculum sp.]HJK12360.1 hypothetical protein [Methanocorpusculum sp.]HJK15240.1 hypothetical protein [Methanocorpusculum sp.]
MSRCETLKLIAVYAVLIAVICLAIFAVIQDINEQRTTPDISLSRLGIPEKDGLSIVSHGVEITTEQEEEVISMVEEFVQENYDGWYAMGYIQVREAATHGVAIEISYNPAWELTYQSFDETHRPNATVLIDRIYVTIPDLPDKRNKLYYYVSPVCDGDLDHTILLPIEKANELLELIGEDPIPPWKTSLIHLLS